MRRSPPRHPPRGPPKFRQCRSQRRSAVAWKRGPTAAGAWSPTRTSRRAAASISVSEIPDRHRRCACGGVINSRSDFARGGEVPEFPHAREGGSAFTAPRCASRNALTSLAGSHSVCSAPHFPVFRIARCESMAQRAGRCVGSWSCTCCVGGPTVRTSHGHSCFDAPSCPRRASFEFRADCFGRGAKGCVCAGGGS
jgi:hypothetical protein